MATYYLLRMKPELNKEMAYFVTLLTVGLWARPPLPAPFVLPVLYKAFAEGYLVAFIKGFIFVFIPVSACLIGIDSYFFGEFVISSFNYAAHVPKGMSDYFGTNPGLFYITNFHMLFMLFKLAYPPGYFALGAYISKHRQQNRPQILAIMVISVVVFFSIIGHKDDRFLLPIAWPLFLMLGDVMVTYHKTLKYFISLFILQALALEWFHTWAFNKY